MKYEEEVKKRRFFRIDIIIVTVFIIVFLLSCDTIKNNNNESVVAKVGNKKLTIKQVELAIPENMKEIDSISFAQNYIEKWVRSQLLLEKAELNLDKATLSNIDMMIDNYRTSLMLFNYQQKIIQQKLDTVVTDEQVLDYYDNNAGNFRLDSCVVRAIFVQLPKSLHDKSKVRSWIVRHTEEDMINLEDYCYQNARDFEMGEEWHYYGEFLSKIPVKKVACSKMIASKKYMEASDSLYAYYTQIIDYRSINDTSPLVFVENKIRDIIINRRKVELIKDLENNIYTDAVSNKKFIIYTNQ